MYSRIQQHVVRDIDHIKLSVQKASTNTAQQYRDVRVAVRPLRTSRATPKQNDLLHGVTASEPLCKFPDGTNEGGLESRC